MNLKKKARSHLGKKGCAGRYCWGNRGPGEGAKGTPGPPESPGPDPVQVS